MRILLVNNIEARGHVSLRCWKLGENITVKNTENYSSELEVGKKVPYSMNTEL